MGIGLTYVGRIFTVSCVERIFGDSLSEYLLYLDFGLKIGLIQFYVCNKGIIIIMFSRLGYDPVFMSSLSISKILLVYPRRSFSLIFEVRVWGGGSFMTTGQFK